MSLLAALLAGCGASAPGCTSNAAPLGRAAAANALAGIQPGEERALGDGLWFKMHRIQVAATSVDGWQTATSSEGGFSVEMPVPYNDFRSRSDATDGVEIRSHSLGGKTPGLLSWTATCMVRRDGGAGSGEAAPPDEIKLLGAPVRAHQRTVQLGDRLCVLIVEAQGTDALPPEADRLRFLRSLRRTGEVSW